MCHAPTWTLMSAYLRTGGGPANCYRVVCALWVGLNFRTFEQLWRPIVICTCDLFNFLIFMRASDQIIIIVILYGTDLKYSRFTNMIVSDSHYYLKQYLHGYVSSWKAMSLSLLRSELFHVYCLKAPLVQRSKRPRWFRLEP